MARMWFDHREQECSDLDRVVLLGSGHVFPLDQRETVTIAADPERPDGMTMIR